MDISILIVRGFTKIISKWDKTLFQKGAASTTFYFKVGQRQFFQSGSMFISKWGKILFRSGAVISKWGITDVIIPISVLRFKKTIQNMDIFLCGEEKMKKSCAIYPLFDLIFTMTGTFTKNDSALEEFFYHFCINY